MVESVHTGHLVVLDAAGRNPVLGRRAPPSGVRQVLAQAAAGGRHARYRGAAGQGGDRAGHRLAFRHRAAPAADRAVAGRRRAGRDRSGLPAGVPIGVAERRAYLIAGHTESRLAMNCSGKHTAMLASCLANDWPLAGYLAPSHPLQQRLATAVAELGGEPVAAPAVDGCGAPLFGLSLVAVARAFGRIASGDGAPGRVAEAMRRPSGTGRRRGPDGHHHDAAGAGPDRQGRRRGRFRRGAAGRRRAGGEDRRRRQRAADWRPPRRCTCWAWTPARWPEFVAAPVLGGGEPVGVIRPAAGW